MMYAVAGLLVFICVVHGGLSAIASDQELPAASAVFFMIAIACGLAACIVWGAA